VKPAVRSDPADVAADEASDVAADVAATDWWPAYVVYCVAEAAGALMLCPAGTTGTCLCVLALQFCLLLRERYWDSITDGVDFHMQLKGVPLMLVCLANGPGATMGTVEFTLPCLPTELSTWATGHCADVGKMDMYECQDLSNIKLFWQSVSVRMF
jgi:hypothetical protein